MKGMPYFKSFVLGLLGLNLTLAAATLTATALPWGFVIALAVTFGLVIVVLSFKFKCGVLFFAGIYACFGSVLTGMYARNYIVAKGAGIIEGLAVTEALNRPQAGGYIFRDGLVRADLEAAFSPRTEVSTISANLLGIMSLPSSPRIGRRATP